MSLAIVTTRAVIGLDAPEITVEVHLSQGLPGLVIVGLPEAAVRESKDRVRSAIINSGFDFPQRRITINLAPADLPKDGARLDLPIAMGILAASGQILADELADYEFVGELALNGDIRSISGTLAVARASAKAGRHVVLPEHNATEAAHIPKASIFSATTLAGLCQHFNQQARLSALPINPLPIYHINYPDLADVKGQHRVRRALEIAAAGGHSMLLSGPPGTGKTMLASRLPSILPNLDDQESLEVASIYSVAGQSYRYGQRPFRSPHHTASGIALVGGGSNPKPGEISLSHLGVLFLDELPEFDRKVLEVLRQPLEAHEIVISRATRQVTYPAKFQLIAAMNPCPCGHLGDAGKTCQCSQDAISRYRGKLSGPLLDRIDLHVEVPTVPMQDLQHKLPGESSVVVRERVMAARNIQLGRQGCINYTLTPKQLDDVAALDINEQKILQLAARHLGLSARAFHRLLRVARTIADLAHSAHISSEHLTEAISYRSFA